MTGPELLKVLRESHHLAALPIVVVSAGIATATDVERARRFVRKPALLEILLAIVKEFCGPPHVAGPHASR